MDCLFADLDNDLDLDFVIATRATGANATQIWMNNGAGTFAKLAGLVADQTAYSYDCGDIDGDGDLDLVGVNAGASSTELLLRNNGAGTSWTNVSTQISPNPAADDNDSRFIDFDNDGDLDLVIAALGAPDRIYRNDGLGTFTQVTTGVMPPVTDSSLDIKVGDVLECYKTIKVQRGLAVHALVGGVDQQCHASKRACAFTPWGGYHAGAKVVGNRLGLVSTAVAQAHLGHSGVQQRSNHGPRSAPSAHHECWARISAPAGVGLLQAVQITKSVGVFSGEAAIGLYHHGVDGAYALRQRLHPVHQRHCCHFVRNGQVAAGKSQLRQSA
jgi:hypothetical protein